MNAEKRSEVRPIRVLIAKPGLDGHDLGAKLICRALIEAGMEVVYTGLRQSPESIARAAVQEDVDVVGLSVLSGAHLPLCQAVSDELARAGAEHRLLLVGGNVPAQDGPKLKQLGVDRIFSTGSPFLEIVEFIREKVQL